MPECLPSLSIRLRVDQIGERFGLAPETMVDIWNVSTGRNFATEVVLKNEVITKRFQGSFALGLMAKDVGIAAGLGRAVGLDAPVSRVVSERLDYARDKLGPTVDNSCAIKAWDE